MDESRYSAIFVCACVRAEGARLWPPTAHDRDLSAADDYAQTDIAIFFVGRIKWRAPCLASFLLCQAVMLISMKMPPLSVDILSSCHTQQQLSLRCSALYCLLVNNGGLSVLRQMLLVCLMHHVRRK